MVTIIPAILAKTLEDLEDKLRQLAPWAPMVHVDIADGQFVPNTTLDLATSVAAPTTVRRSFHLMVTDPLGQLAAVSLKETDQVLLHVEHLTTRHPLLQSSQTGLVINPETDLFRWQKLFALVSALMVMGIEPGFQGHPLLPQTLGRIRQLRRWFPQKTIIVDGGVHHETIRSLCEAGATALIVGSGLWQSANPHAAYRDLVTLANSSSVSGD
ncbi:hypothetical protein HY523_02910 [Candidatus Berkelbacteria bacterium]|nr:hypothetical protein [Candidatus Berkelbacteria bacterium]